MSRCPPREQLARLPERLRLPLEGQARSGADRQYPRQDSNL